MANSAPDELLVTDIFRTIRLDEGLLSVQAARQVRELIQAGELHRGERLPSERELCEQLGVSRTVVREAIKMLRASGLVKVRLGVGTFIAEEPANILEGTLNYANDQEARKISDLQQVREVLRASCGSPGCPECQTRGYPKNRTGDPGHGAQHAERLPLRRGG